MITRVLKWFMAGSMLFGCDQAQPKAGSSTTAEKPGQASSSKSTRPFSKEVLPGNLAMFAKPVGEGQTPRSLAHGPPPMDKEARGNYSYLGAANEFKAICGFEMPEWVEPVEGSYYITMDGDKFASQANLNYFIEPTRRDELADLMVKNIATPRPEIPVVKFVMQPIEGEPDALIATFRIKTKAGRLDKYSMRLNADGKVALFSTRAPTGWYD